MNKYKQLIFKRGINDTLRSGYILNTDTSTAVHMLTFLSAGYRRHNFVDFERKINHNIRKTILDGAQFIQVIVNPFKLRTSTYI